MGPQFHETPMGRKFFEGQLPALIGALEKIGNPLIKTADKPVQSHLFKDPYVRLDFKGYKIAVKLGDEGVLIGIWINEGGSPIATEYKLYTNMMEG